MHTKKIDTRFVCLTLEYNWLAIDGKVKYEYGGINRQHKKKRKCVNINYKILFNLLCLRVCLLAAADLQI